jgi:hypothetical protein
VQIKCGSDARRSAVRGSADWNGIDYLEIRTSTEKNIVYKNPLIIVHCFKAISGLEADNVLFSGGVRVKEIAAEWAYPANEVIASHQDKVSSGELQFLNTIENPTNALVIRSNSAGDFSIYKLSLVESADTPGTPPTGFDVILSQVEFSFKVECPNEYDCACIESHPSQQKLPEPAIDYMAKDYASFRKLMLDRLSLIMPDWKERNPADIGIMLVELLAYVGDHLSYYQDAVATEAYLGTARSRISAARHARLLDYSVNEGRNSRAWICFEVAVPNLLLPKGAQLLTKTGDEKTTSTDPVIKVDLQEALIKGAEVFESMYEVTFYKSRNKMSFYTWSETDCWLPAGSTSATLNGSGLDTIDIFIWENVPGGDSDKLTSYLANNFGLEWLDTAVVEKDSDSDTVITISSGNKKKLTITLQEDKATLAIGGKDLYVFQVEEDPDHKRLVKSSSLRVGDVLVFAEETLSPTSGGLPNLNHRHAVRVTSVAAGTDELTEVDVLEIEWDQKDALPFSLCLEKDGKPGCTIYGNVVLADHGYTKKTEDIAATTTTSNVFEQRKFKDRVVAGKYYPRLDEKPLTRCGPGFEITAGKGGSAASAFDYDSNKVTPAITLLDTNSVSWEPARDPFSGDEFASMFVVETESDGTAYLRFSEQNREAWARQISEGTFKGFIATYRIGNGANGNVGAESITSATGPSAPAGITKIFNPMPARGGQDPETIESIRLHAPHSFRKQERAVTASDYEEVLKRHPGIQKAAAEKRWTGSWYTMFVAIDRVGGMDVDKDFEAEIVGFLEKYRLAGYDVEIQSPIYVPLKISIEVCLKDGYFGGEVKEELLKIFSSRAIQDGGDSSSKGFFHPDKFTFGQRLYLSRVYEVALSVAGVSSVIINEFHRWGKEARRELEDGYIKAGPMEILRLDNDSNFAENGMIDFSFCGETGVGGVGA